MAEKVNFTDHLTSEQQYLVHMQVNRSLAGVLPLQDLAAEIIKLFPLQRGDRGTMRRQVAALGLAADLLFEAAVSAGTDRREVASEAKLRSIPEHAHRQGSLESFVVTDSRRIWLLDLETSKAKFTDDIGKLVKLLQKTRMEQGA